MNLPSLFGGKFGGRRLEVASFTDAGLARVDNQDCMLVDSEDKVFCVADGMGGEAHGAMASRIVCETLRRCTVVQEFEKRIEAADAAVISASSSICRYASEHGGERMGTTVAMLIFEPKAVEQVAIGYAGDTRVYRRRGARLERMTEDHRKSEYSHFLTKAVGTAETVEVDWKMASVNSGDTWLICCDGVHDMLPDTTINGILAQTVDVKSQCGRLAEAVRNAGARDNFTFIIIKVK